MFPLFHAAVPNGIAIASSPVQLLALGVPYELDNEALATFHLLGYFIDSQTPRTLIAITRSNISSSASAIAAVT